MYYDSEVIRYLQANNILALKLDHAFSAVGQQVTSQVEMVGEGVTRLLYYTSCFTDEYNDVCKQQKIEDIRFRDAAYKLVRHSDVVYDMLKTYFAQIFKYKTNDQLEYIKKMLMAANVHIAATSLTSTGFTFSVDSAVRAGLNISLELSGLTGTWASRGIAAVGIYGLVQKAADSAYRLHIQFPTYYAALYVQGLEMMYFLIEPIFHKAGALGSSLSSDSEIANIITRMIR
ncbi:hypothetical protein I7V28_17000 [Lelliottia amnigena]|uniref:hypothetical protein n=1 Tax=Lelliottia amnigena TaxID=61646 RepID=UPI00192ABF8A|nr:hypothetical protein [Lelliottia amnigena]MBL5922778.1 hypothetical protein [Lelliottia amnigena]